MLGAIAGDIIGSRFEHNNIKSTEFKLFHKDCRFTDDTVLTVAVADSIIKGTNLKDNFKSYFLRYPNAGYGKKFTEWAASPKLEPYGSYGNGAAMRVSPVGFAFDSLEIVLEKAKATSEITHNHPEGIKGAQATAASIFLAKTGHSKQSIQTYVESNFGYSFADKIKNLQKTYQYDVSCQGSVPQAILAFLESQNFEDAIRKAVSIGGDSDTIACITGGIAQAYYKRVPDSIFDRVYEYLDSPLRQIVTLFNNRFSCF